MRPSAGFWAFAGINQLRPSPLAPALLPTATVVDAMTIAREQVGNERTMNMVLAGALSKVLPLPEECWLEAMKLMLTGAKAKLLPANEKAFALGRAAV